VPPQRAVDRVLHSMSGEISLGIEFGESSISRGLSELVYGARDGRIRNSGGLAAAWKVVPPWVHTDGGKMIFGPLDQKSAVAIRFRVIP
jgi:hypothetical protein